jgi:hypothetical protein
MKKFQVGKNESKNFILYFAQFSFDIILNSSLHTSQFPQLDIYQTLSIHMQVCVPGHFTVHHNCDLSGTDRFVHCCSLELKLKHLLKKYIAQKTYSRML